MVREGINIKVVRRCNISKLCLWLKMFVWVFINDFLDKFIDKDFCLFEGCRVLCLVLFF